MHMPTTATRLVVTTLAAALLLAACSSDDGSDDASPDGAGETTSAPSGTAAPAASGSLEMLIASSGDAETQAVEEATAAWTEESGVEVEVLVAQDINQQLGQALAGGTPPDLFYVDAGRFGDYAANGALYPYVDQLEGADDFYASLTDTFSFDGEAVCAPKDFSTLALVINTELWEAAGLTDDDIPTTWEELATVATTLTEGDTIGLGVGDTRDRLAAFMVGAGGWFVSDDGTTATVDSPENEEALAYLETLRNDGVLQYPSQLDAGWGGEAFGIQRAAMTIEGNWIKGALANDFPDIAYTVVEMPEGPAGAGTLLFTQCWGIAEVSDNHDAAVDLVDHLTSVDSQLAFAEAFGVMPSRMSAEEDYVAAFPDDAAFIAGGEYGHGPVTVPGFDQVLADFDAQLQQLGSVPPSQILQSTQTNAEAALGG